MKEILYEHRTNTGPVQPGLHQDRQVPGPITRCLHGSPHNISSYLARFPVMGPFVEVFVYNRAAMARKVSVWGYLVS